MTMSVWPMTSRASSPWPLSLTTCARSGKGQILPMAIRQTKSHLFVCFLCGANNSSHGGDYLVNGQVDQMLCDFFIKEHKLQIWLCPTIVLQMVLLLSRRLGSMSKVMDVCRRQTPSFRGPQMFSEDFIVHHPFSESEITSISSVFNLPWWLPEGKGDFQILWEGCSSVYSLGPWRKHPFSQYKWSIPEWLLDFHDTMF